MPMHVVRFTIDLFRPIPLRPLGVMTDIRRDGRRIQVVDASLFDGDVELGRATALKLRTTEIDLPGGDIPWMESAGPETIDVLDGAATETVRYRGSTTTRSRSEVSTTASSPIGRACLGSDSSFRSWRVRSRPRSFASPTLSDMANGNSRAIDPAQWLFVNPDITIYCHRPYVGEYVGMHSGGVSAPVRDRNHRHLVLRPEGRPRADQPSPIDRTPPNPNLIAVIGLTNERSFVSFGGCTQTN